MKPQVTCLCPTYGRFERLRDAIACFLLQDYPAKRMFIVDDSVVGTSRKGLPPEIRIINVAWVPRLEQEMSRTAIPIWPRYPTLGDKRQALLEMAQTPLVAHWDDDDLYLPWHLSHCVDALTRASSLNPQSAIRNSQSPLMVKPRGAWWALGQGADFTVKGPCHNVFEGQVVFDREAALAIDGYPPKISGQAEVLIRKFKRLGRFHRFDPWPYISYVYRWGDGLWHISGGGDKQSSQNAFAAKNNDFGDGQPILPPSTDNYQLSTIPWARNRLRPLFERLLEGIRKLTLRADYTAIETRLRSYW